MNSKPQTPNHPPERTSTPRKKTPTLIRHMSLMLQPYEISCQDVHAKLQAESDFLLIDCREADEHEIVSIAAARLLPMSQLAERIDELTPHREREIVIHCHHGGRSLRVTHWLLEQGFTNVKSMAGGIEVWATVIEPGLPRY